MCCVLCVLIGVDMGFAQQVGFFFLIFGFCVLCFDLHLIGVGGFDG